MTETDKAKASNQKTSTEVKSSSSAVTNSASSQNPELVTLKNTLRTFWSSKKNTNLPKINEELSTLFAKYNQPLEEYLEFLDIILDHGWSGNLSFHVTKQFITWLAAPEREKPEGGFTADQRTQLKAMTITSRASSRDIKTLIFQLYQLADNPEIISTIASQLKEKNLYFQLSQWVCLFNAEAKFDLSDYVYPMLLTRNCFDVFPYLEAHPNVVTDVIKHADNIFYNNKDLTQQFADYNFPPPKKHVLVSVCKNIESLMKKCIKKFNISSELTPNFNKKLIETELRFYVLSLSRNDMTQEGFKERVAPLCQDDTERQKFLVQNLLKRKQTEYLAEFYCNQYKIDTEHPKGIQRGELEEDYHTIDSLFDMIVFVDSQQTANSMLQYVDSLCEDVAEENATVPGIPVGLDSEWKSICGVNVVRPPALLQVAFERRIFLVDITNLHSNIDFWKQLSEKLLQNNRFIKLGYGLDDDQCKFDYYPALSFVNLGGSGSLDLLKEEKKYHKNSVQIKFPYEIEESGNNGKSMRGLSRLVALCYSKPLDKREQLSDWERRPLRNPQILYAAMDAYCLLEVYNVLKDMHKEANLRFNIRGDNAQTSNKARFRPEGRRRFRGPFIKRRPNFRRYRNFRKKVEVSIQATADSSEVSTQTPEQREG